MADQTMKDWLKERGFVQAGDEWGLCPGGNFLAVPIIKLTSYIVEDAEEDAETMRLLKAQVLERLA